MPRKRFRGTSNPYVPTLRIDEDGSITHKSEAASRLLEYSDPSKMDSCFFTHIHGRNLYHVMRDIADMVRFAKSQAKWLLRVRTGQGRWRWYRAKATNKLNQDNACIEIKLHDLHTW